MSLFLPSVEGVVNRALLTADFSCSLKRAQKKSDASHDITKRYVTNVNYGDPEC